MKLRIEKAAKYQLQIFFLLAFAITWTAQIAVYLYAYKKNIEINNESIFLYFRELVSGNLAPGFKPYLLLFLFSFGPSVSGVLTVALFKGKRGLLELLKCLSRVRIATRWIVIIILIPVIWNATSLALGYIIGGLQPIEFNFLVPLTCFVPFLFFMIFFTGLSEEVGWRGYALPELQKKFTAEKSSWILGIMWGLWHIPSVLLMPYLQNELTLPIVISMIAGLTIGIVGWTIVITWTYNNTQSLFWIVILHGLSNTIQSYMLLSSNNLPAMSIWIIIPWIFAIYLLKNMVVRLC